MKRSTIICAVVLMAVTGLVLAGGPEGKVYGDGVKLEKAVAIEALHTTPEEFVGKSVRVDGVITGVCKKRGCWIQISDSETGKGVRIKVEDGVIVFPYTAMGSRASAEGTFEAMSVTVEEAKHSSEQGVDHENCTAGAHKKENVIYQISGTGAVIYPGS